MVDDLADSPGLPQRHHRLYVSFPRLFVSMTLNQGCASAHRREHVTEPLLPVRNTHGLQHVCEEGNVLVFLLDVGFTSSLKDSGNTAIALLGCYRIMRKDEYLGSIGSKVPTLALKLFPKRMQVCTRRSNSARARARESVSHKSTGLRQYFCSGGATETAWAWKEAIGCAEAVSYRTPSTSDSVLLSSFIA